MNSLTFQINGKTFIVPDDFSHPGGKQILRRYCGEDVTNIFRGLNGGHEHSPAAWALLQQFNKERNQEVSDFSGWRKSREDALVDEQRPLLQQVWKLGPEYFEWVHTPVAGQPRFFYSNIAELVTRVKWWFVPLLWLPVVVFTFHRAIQSALSLNLAVVHMIVGVLVWQLVEYSIHRFVFHARPRNSCGIFLHFLFHGCHHRYPMDVDRLVFPPIPASPIVYFFYTLLHGVLPQAVANAMFSGMLLGYVAYDCIHYFQHSGLLGGRLRAVHMHHHYVDPTVNYGISSQIYDILLGTSAKVVAGKGASAAKEVDTD